MIVIDRALGAFFHAGGVWALLLLYALLAVR